MNDVVSAFSKKGKDGEMGEAGWHRGQDCDAGVADAIFANDIIHSGWSGLRNPQLIVSQI